MGQAGGLGWAAWVCTITTRRMLSVMEVRLRRLHNVMLGLYAAWLEGTHTSGSVGLSISPIISPQAPESTRLLSDHRDLTDLSSLFSYSVSVLSRCGIVYDTNSNTITM